MSVSGSSWDLEGFFSHNHLEEEGNPPLPLWMTCLEELKEVRAGFDLKTIFGHMVEQHSGLSDWRGPEPTYIDGNVVSLGVVTKLCSLAGIGSFPKPGPYVYHCISKATTPASFWVWPGVVGSPQSWPSKAFTMACVCCAWFLQVSLMTEPGTRDNWGEPATKARSQPSTIPILASLSYTFIIFHPSKQAPCRDFVLYSLHLLKWLEVSLFIPHRRKIPILQGCESTQFVRDVLNVWRWRNLLPNSCRSRKRRGPSAVKAALQQEKQVGRPRTATNGWPKSVQAESSTSPEYRSWSGLSIFCNNTIHDNTHTFGAIWVGWRLWPELLPGRLSPCAVMLDQRITKLSTSVNLMSNSVSDRVTKMCKKIGDLGSSCSRTRFWLFSALIL